MKVLMIFAFALMLSACGADQSSKKEETVGKEIADDYNRQIDRARDVENQVMEQKRQIDEALKEAEDN